MSAAVLARPTVRVRTGAEALELLDERWDALALEAPVPNPLLSAPWLRTVAELETGVPLVAVVEEDGGLSAGAALALRRPAGRLGPLVATWLGPAEQLRTPDVLALPGRLDAADALVEAVLDAADLLSIGVRCDGNAAAALDAVAPWRRSEPTGEGWLLAWPAPKLESDRKRVARDLRRAERASVPVEIHVRSEPEEIEPALERLFRLHRGRWRDRGGERPHFATNAPLRRWNRLAVARMARCGRALIVEVLEDGVPVAAALSFLFGRGAVGHTQAIRPARVLREPGNAAVLAAVEALGEAGARTVDLGIGCAEPNSPKARLGPTADPRTVILAAASPQRQHLYQAVRRLKRTVR